MTTRQELLRGVQKVNNERIDSKVAATRSSKEVLGVSADGTDQPTGRSGPPATPKEETLPGLETSLDEILARREATCRKELAGIIETLTGLIARRDQLQYELDRIEEIKDAENRDVGLSTTDAPTEVL